MLPKKDGIFVIASRTSTPGNFKVLKQHFFRNESRSRINNGRPGQQQKERIDLDKGFNQLVGESEPERGNGQSSGEVQEICFEKVIEEGDFANARVDIALGFGLHGELGSFFLQILFEGIEVLVGHGRRALEVILHGLHVGGFFAVHDHHGRSTPGQIFLQQIEFIIVQQLAARGVVGLHGVHKDAFLFFNRQSHELPRFFIGDTKFIIRNTIIFINGGFKKASPFFIPGNLFFEDRFHQGGIFLFAVTVVTHKTSQCCFSRKGGGNRVMMTGLWNSKGLDRRQANQGQGNFVGSTRYHVDVGW
mmetsp:Transcript_16098/g.33316  ORF Transcript_16098/g.33316 Transcript_16098/m.33316 type:complete len:304 (+) Transcript_16098:473-1384(+)